MAEVKTIKIDVDTKQATKAMDDLAKATHDVSASFEEVYGDITTPYCSYGRSRRPLI
jgi:hypothetical protein